MCVVGWAFSVEKSLGISRVGQFGVDQDIDLVRGMTQSAALLAQCQRNTCTSYEK